MVMVKTDEVESEKGGDNTLQAYKDCPRTPQKSEVLMAKAKLFNV
ncbi:MAG: hypothetical protein ABSF38_13360 [Verrucomicrobiota bacterium]|jgi:hypothetical protein